MNRILNRLESLERVSSSVVLFTGLFVIISVNFCMVNASTTDPIPKLIAPIVNLTTSASNDNVTFDHLDVNVNGFIENANSIPIYNVSITLEFDLTLLEIYPRPYPFSDKIRTITIGTISGNEVIQINETFAFSYPYSGSVRFNSLSHDVNWTEPMDSDPVPNIEPSIPEFTVRFVAYPYDVPEKTVTTVDQYTGKETVKTTPGYRVENKSIEIVVKNQPFTHFTPYTDEDGHEINLFYDVQVKGHYGDDWETFGASYSYGAGREPNAQLDSEYTIISIEPEYPGDAVLDFRVQSLVGYYYPYGRGAMIWGWDFEGQESGWSQIQTFSLAETKFEVIPEFPSWIILPLFLVVTSLVVVVRKYNGFGDFAK